MKIKVVELDGQTVAIVESEEVILQDVNSVLDFLASVDYETGCDRMAMSKAALPEEFFDLRTGLAGEILQKVVNYRHKLAIYGDFSGYTSKALRDFIYECNHGKDIFFVESEDEAVRRLAKV